jgi:hypothetical protein
MAKASRPYLSKIKNKEVRQRVKDANQRWTRMTNLPTNFLDFIFKNKDFIPLCTICYENLSPTTFNLCYTCITTLSNYQQQLNTLEIIPNTNTFNINYENISEEIEPFFINYFP